MFSVVNESPYYIDSHPFEANPMKNKTLFYTRDFTEQKMFRKYYKKCYKKYDKK